MFTSHNLICKINNNFCRKTMHSLKVLYYLSVFLSYKDCLGLFNVAKIQGLVFLLMAFAYYRFSSVQFSPVTQLCPALCDFTNCSMPGFPVHHQLLELAQTHVHRVGDAIQPSHPLSFPSPTFNLSQPQGLFK